MTKKVPVTEKVPITEKAPMTEEVPVTEKAPKMTCIHRHLPSPALFLGLQRKIRTIPDHHHFTLPYPEHPC